MNNKRPSDVRETVSRAYADALGRPATQACCGPEPKGTLARRAGYQQEELAGLPEDAAPNSFGCGNPLAFGEVREGDVVLDLGCGAGIDVVLAAGKVGPTGRVIGVDMTDQMIAKARAVIAEAGLTNAEIRKGMIEDLPVEAASVDWVISNCVVNLSPEKSRVFAEIARVLKPGGRVLVSDVIAEGLPQAVLENLRFYSCCAAGALSEREYRDGLEQVGLVDIEIHKRLELDREQVEALLESDRRAFELADRCCEEPAKAGPAVCDVATACAGKVWTAEILARKPRVGARLHLLPALFGMTVALAASSTAIGAPPAAWHQWGGVTRDFKSTATNLADRWPADGPKRLWSRPLGEGYSSIVSNGDTLFTMYRQDDDEVVVALDAKTGRTVWEHRYRAKPYPTQTADFGQGPNATPLIHGDRIITVGFTGSVHCLRLDTGQPLWSHRLEKDFGGKTHYYGYANSPLEYEGSILVLVGGDKNGVVALDPADGSTSWRSKPYDTSYAAPVLINVDGQDQFVFFTTNEVVGIDPTSGSHLWSHLVVNYCKTNCTSAVWGRDNLLWAATKGVGGTRVLRLGQQAGKTSVEEVWLDRKIKVYHWNAQRIGDFIYTSNGDTQKFLSVIDIKTGQVVKKMRGFGSTNGIHVDGKLILLDDGGKLALAEVSPGDIKIVSRTQLFDSVTWTPPTLVGTTLYVRDRKNIMAVELGSKAQRAQRAQSSLSHAAHAKGEH